MNTENREVPDFYGNDEAVEQQPEVIDPDDYKDTTKSEEKPDKKKDQQPTSIFDSVSDTITLGIIQVNYKLRKLPNGDERPVVHALCRNPDESTEDNRYMVEIHQQEPYFYIQDTETHKLDLSDDRIKRTESGFESIRGESLTRVYATTPRVVGQMRNDFDTHYEADVLFPDRFLIDNHIENGFTIPERYKNESENILQITPDEVTPTNTHVDIRTHTVDIEVEDRNGFPEPEDAMEPVICITAHDSYDDAYTVWYAQPEENVDVPTSLDEYEYVNSKPNRFDVRVFESEEAMLVDYISYIKSTQPDLITGWNVDDFDAQYLLNRLEKLNDFSKRDLDPERLSPLDEVWDGGWNGPNIKGLVLFDLLDAFKRTQFTELESYRLGDIGERELGIGKEHYEGKIGDLWENDPEQLIEYNLRDVEICVELDRKQEIINFWNSTRSYVGCRIQDAPTPGDAVDMYVLQKSNGRFVLPSKGQMAEDAEDFEGGQVFEPISGIEKMVSALDLKSLYPMCMTTVNASPETKVDPETYDGETYVTPNGVHFRKDKDGIMREMIDELLEEREQKKALRNEHDNGTEEFNKFDREQGAIKVIMNSLYGVSGWDRFRLYDKDQASGVTATGREVIEFTETAANELGYEVTYGDTDSVLLSLDNELSIEEAIEISFEIEEKINEAYNDFAKDKLNASEHRFQIEFEKLYKRFLQAGKKKRYAGHILWKEGQDVDKYEITGFEYKRSDIAGITKETQYELIVRLLDGESTQNIREYISNIISDFQNGDIPLSDIAIPGGIGKELDNYENPQAHVRGALYANTLLGLNLGKGSKPKRVYLSRVHNDFFKQVEAPESEGGLALDPTTTPIYGEFKRDPDVISFEYAYQVPDEFVVDYDKMIEKTLEGPLGRILQAVDIDWEAVKSGEKQTGISSFM